MNVFFFQSDSTWIVSYLGTDLSKSLWWQSLKTETWFSCLCFTTIMVINPRPFLPLPYSHESCVKVKCRPQLHTVIYDCRSSFWDVHCLTCIKTWARIPLETRQLGEKFWWSKCNLSSVNIFFSVILQYKRKRKTGVKGGENPWKDYAIARPLETILQVGNTKEISTTSLSWFVQVTYVFVLQVVLE